MDSKTITVTSPLLPVILPSCHYIGKFARVGAGAVVTKDVMDFDIVAGVYGGKSKGLEMIQCDKCENWYHTKCLGIAPEEVQKIGENVWFCPKCEKSDVESKKDSEDAN